MNLVLLFILVSCGGLGAVVATDDGNLSFTDSLTERLERLETENQDKDALIQDLTNERDELNFVLSLMQAEMQRLEPFKIAGEWSSWGDWSFCTRSCGGGVRERTRVCDNPSASCGGPECVGNEMETASCNNHACGPQAIFISTDADDYFDGHHSTEVLDLESSPCSRTTADLPDRRRYHSSHLLNNSLVICGGYFTLDSCITSSSPTTGDWRNHSTMTEPRYGHSGSVIGNKMYLVAGVGRADHSRPTGHTTDYWDGERWEEGPRLPHKVGDESCTVTISPTKILVTGGIIGGSKVVELNINTGRWRNLANMKGTRWGHACLVVGRKVVVAGGSPNGRYAQKTSEILDLDTEQWSMAGDLTTERDNAKLVTVNGRVIILGGYDASWKKLDTVEELDMDQRTWRKLRVFMKKPRVKFGATVMDREDLCN